MQHLRCPDTPPRFHPAFDEDYTYDNLNRLTDTNRNSADYQAWDLDALGNSNSVTTSGVTQNRTHNSQNQLTGLGSSDLAFDANGNTTTDQNGRTLVYDSWNRLVEAKSGSTSLIRYEYDGLTRRIEEGSTDQYFSAAWQVLEERVANAVTASYAWSPVYVDAMIARDRDSDANGSLDERLYALQDANFNVTAIADTSGDIVERYLFDPYGQRTILDPNFSADADNTSDFAFMHGHQGGKYDTVLTNQMLFRNRVYDVETMRWMQQDPLGYIEGANAYQFARSMPLSRMDPEGTDSIKEAASELTAREVVEIIKRGESAAAKRGGEALGAGISLWKAFKEIRDSAKTVLEMSTILTTSDPRRLNAAAQSMLERESEDVLQKALEKVLASAGHTRLGGLYASIAIAAIKEASGYGQMLADVVLDSKLRQIADLVLQ